MADTTTAPRMCLKNVIASMANWWTVEGVIIIVSIVTLTFLKNFLFLDFLGQTMNRMYRIHFVFYIINKYDFYVNIIFI